MRINVVLTSGNFKRVYDFTCCDIEPAVIGTSSYFILSFLARNVMLLTFLLDNVDVPNETAPDYWSIFYDLHVNAQTLDVIRKHSQKLVDVSQDLAAWASTEYNNIVQILNSETLNLLREYWVKYATFDDADDSIMERFVDQSDEILEKEPKSYEARTVQALGRSFGPRFGDCNKVVVESVNYFCRHGGMTNTCWTIDQDVNPLILYSSTGGDQYIIDYRTNSLAAFHLAPAVTVIDPKPPYVNYPKKDEAVVLTAMLQFKAWCSAFQHVARSSSRNRVRIRFYIGDALNFCRALNHLQSNRSIDIDIYSAPWSSQSLQLDGGHYTSGSDNRAPVLFNVIETSGLSDATGLVNVLTAAVPLLERAPSSVLYTDTMRSIPSELEAPNLLTDLLCGDVSIMCSLFGVIPAPYVTGVTTQARDDTFINMIQPIFNRIQWKIATSFDPRVNPLETKLSFDPEPLADLLYSIYLKMFECELIIKQHGNYDHEIRQPQYSKSSYAAFLAFLKPRINVDWEKFMETLIQKLDKHPVFGVHFADVLLQFYVFGVYRALAYQRDPTPDKFDSSLSERTKKRVAMLTRQKSTGLIVTIPRSKLTIVSEKCIEEGHHSQIIFEVDIAAGNRRNTFSSIHPIFGKLSSIDGKTFGIIRDATGWFGSSDLHVCLYVPSYLFLETDPKNLKVVVRFKKEAGVYFVFKGTSLGVELEIFKSTMDTIENVRLSEALPNLTAAAPSFITSIPETAHIAKEDVTLTFPLLNPRNGNFTTRITVTKQEEKDVLSRGADVKLTQNSPCTLVVSYDQFEHACHFPFPVTTQASRLKVARKSGWIEVCAEILPLQIVSAARLNPLPLTWDTNHVFSPWNAPYVNFNQLPRIAIGRNPNLYPSWLQTHLDGMVSDVELTQSGPDMVGQNYWFKHSIITIFKYVAEKLTANDPVSLVLVPAGDPEEYGGMLFFIFTGLYFDGNMQSVVVKGYVVEVNQSTLGNPRFLPIVNKWILSGRSPDIRPEVFMLWKRALPVMAERCRDYPHVPACRFAKGLPALLELEEAHVCGCGIGKVGGDLKDSKYAAATPFVTPVAISPLFHAGYIESTRHGVLDYNTGTTRDRFSQSLPESEYLRSRPQPTSTTSSPSHVVKEESTVKKCKSCGKDGVKTCGRCGQVYYCSRKCQQNDWKRHKPECKSAKKK